MTLEEKAANLDAKHDRCDGYDSCGCFNRLLAAVRGEPDPDGEAYRWPIYSYGCEEPPSFGPETPMEYTMRQCRQRIAEAVFANHGTLMSNSFQGLDSLDNSITFIGWD